MNTEAKELPPLEGPGVDLREATNGYELVLKRRDGAELAIFMPSLAVVSRAAYFMVELIGQERAHMIDECQAQVTRTLDAIEAGRKKL